MRIRTAIFVVYVAASAVGLAVLMRFVLGEVRPRQVEAVRANLADATHALAAALAGRTREEAAAALTGRASFRVQLQDAAGRAWFDSAGREEARADADATDGSGWGSRLLDGPAAEEGPELATAASVTLRGGERARLVLSRSLRGVNAVVGAERRKLAGMALVVAVVMVGAGWWIAARLTRSLERLTAHVRAVRDGGPTAPPVSRATEIAALTTAFEEMREALDGRRQAERATQALAHEVKAPLAAIRAAAELMDEELPVAERAKFLAHIRAEAARIQQIVERLLELSTVEARRALQRRESLVVAEVVGEAVAGLRPAFAAARVELAVADGAELRCQGERFLLRQAVVNLLQNALDFSPPGGRVRVTVARVGERVEVGVEDDGPGVPDYALPRVFERFYSLPRPGSGARSTGIGLALVREIAHQHGGEVTLANRSGGGARAGLTVPAA